MKFCEIWVFLERWFLNYNDSALSEGVMNEADRSSKYEFGSFRLDTRTRRLLHDDKPLPITSKAFDTLVVLLNSAGNTVSKTDLMNGVWPGTAVEENNLTQQISALRKAFGERAGDHKFIVTVPGRGYCFVANVRKFATEPDGQIGVQPEADKARRRIAAAATFGSSSLLGYGLAAIYVLVICVPAFVASWRAEARGIKPQSIAIMQFRSAGVGDELLGMGIRDTLRAKLGSLEDVTVRPDDTVVADDVVDAGRQLNVDVIVTGSIQHDEDKIRVAVEMVDVSNERIIWGSTFDDTFSNSFELQDSITNAVLSALKRPKISGEMRAPKGNVRNSGYAGSARVREPAFARGKPKNYYSLRPFDQLVS